jgi:alpha-N-arabinofuranosidase
MLIIQDHNTFDDPNKIKPQTFTDAKLNGSDLEVKLPPFSVVVLELK